MRVSVICPVLNEVDFIGYSILAALPYMHEFVYALDSASSDGTRELLEHVKEKYVHEKLVILDHPTFHPHDVASYNGAFNRCIETSTGDACMFLHPDMVIVGQNPVTASNDALAWITHITSYAGDMQTVITKGRADKWKNIHAKKFGLHYSGGYGSQNEDFYHSEVTGKSCKHFGMEFSKYPFQVADSGLKINHYCELKSYKRRLEKMKLCLKTLIPTATDAAVEESAAQHPRVTLESSCERFGEFKFEESKEPVPEVFEKYREEFSQFQKEGLWPFQKQPLKVQPQTEPISI